jgi:uncharacterized protein YndB with AHSA1/START domain
MLTTMIPQFLAGIDLQEPRWMALGIVALFSFCASSCSSTNSSATNSSDRVPIDQENAMRVEQASDRETVLARTFSAPRETVFAAMTQAEHLIHWMAASGMSLVQCEVDLRVGGTLRYVFQRGNGRRIEVRGVFEQVDPPHGFVYLESYDFSPLEVRVGTTFTASGPTTQFRRVLAYASKRERDEDFEGVATSSKEAFLRLENYLSEYKPATSGSSKRSPPR